MTVKAYCLSKGTPDEHFELRYAYDGAVIPSSPDNWKTHKGAIRWALAHGLQIEPDEAEKYKTSKTKQQILEIIVSEFEKAHQKAKGNPYATSEACIRETALLDLMKKIEIYDAN